MSQVPGKVERIEAPDIDAVKGELAVMVVGIKDQSQALQAFGLVQQISDEPGLIEALDGLSELLNGVEAFSTLKERVEIQTLGEGFPEGSLKRTLAVAVLRSSTKGRALDQLRALEEDDIGAAISVVMAAVELQTSVNLDGVIEGKMVKPRSEYFKRLAAEIVELRVAHPGDVRTKNLMIILQASDSEGAKNDLLAAVVARVKKDLEGDIAEPEIPVEAEVETAMAQDVVARAADATLELADARALVPLTGPRAQALCLVQAAEPVGAGAQMEAGSAVVHAAVAPKGAVASGDDNVDPPEDEGYGEPDAGWGEGSFVKKLMMSKTQDMVAHYQSVDEEIQGHMRAKTKEQLQTAIQTKNALVFVYFYSFAKAIGIADEVQLYEEDLREMYVTMVVMKGDLRAMGRFVNCVTRECPEIAGVDEGDTQALKQKWAPRDEEYPKPLTPEQVRQLEPLTEWTSALRESTDVLTFRVAMKKCSTPYNLVLAAVVDFLSDQDEKGMAVVEKALKATRSNDNKMDFDTRAKNIGAAFEKAVEVFIHDDSVEARDIQTLRKLCEEHKGEEVYERIGRSIQKYTKVGRFCHLENEQIDTLEMLEHAAGKPFISLLALFRSEDMKEVADKLLDEAIEEIYETNHAPSLASRMEKRRAVAERFAKIFAKFYQNLGYRGGVRGEFFKVGRERLSNPREDQDRDCVNILGEALALQIFPDFACSPANRKMFALITDFKNNLPFRRALESLETREAKVCFMALAKNDLLTAINLLIDIAGAGDSKDVAALQIVFTTLSREEIIEKSAIQAALDGPKCRIGKEDEDWAALQDEEKETIADLLSKLGRS